MKQFTLELNEDLQRPIIMLKKPVSLDAMLDTGALFPIWVGSEVHLREIGGEFAAKDIPFGGFGGMTKGNLYHLPNFCIGDLIYPSLPVLVSPRKLPCQLLLSATMFSRLIYEIDDHNHRFNVTIPDRESHIRKLVIEDRNGKLHVLCTSGDE